LDAADFKVEVNGEKKEELWVEECPGGQV